MQCSIEQWRKPWLFVDVEGECTTRLYDSLLMGSGFEATSKLTYRHVPGLKSPFFRQSIHVYFVYFPGYYIKLLETTTKTFFFTSELVTTHRHFSHHIWWTFWLGPVGSLESEAYKNNVLQPQISNVLKEWWTQNNSNWYIFQFELDMLILHIFLRVVKLSTNTVLSNRSHFFDDNNHQFNESSVVKEHHYGEGSLIPGILRHGIGSP